MDKIQVAILGTGNIGTDLMYKILKNSDVMELSMFAGIDKNSEGLKLAQSEGVPNSCHGIDAILEDPDINIVFEATSAKAHLKHAPEFKKHKKIAVDLTPAAVGPFVVPSVNLDQIHKQHSLDELNINMISCGAQASIPLINAVKNIVDIEYAELITATASKSIGMGTRQNIDEFTYTSARAIEKLGGATKARVIPVINPADPPIKMSNTVYIVPHDNNFDESKVKDSIMDTVDYVKRYVPGYRMKTDPIIDYKDTPWGEKPVIVMLNEVEGAGDYLPKYSGNLDIMTAAAWMAGESISNILLERIKI